MATIIKPTVGRVVWYFASHTDTTPRAAIIAHVHGDHLVNLVIFNEAGVPFGRQDVNVRQADDEIAPGDRCEWMPYQLGQAAKTEELAKQQRGDA